jgi:hypothetical protein
MLGLIIYSVRDTPLTEARVGFWGGTNPRFLFLSSEDASFSPYLLTASLFLSQPPLAACIRCLHPAPFLVSLH